MDVTAGHPAEWLPPEPPAVEWLSVMADVAELAPGAYATGRGTLVVSQPRE